MKQKKWYVAILMVMMIAPPVPEAAWAAETPISLRVDGLTLRLPEGEAGPVISPQGRVLVPARWIAEAMGIDVRWHPETRQVTFQDDDQQTILVLDSSEALINQAPVRLDSPAVIIRGRTFVPVRFVSEAFGAHVTWNTNLQQVQIESMQLLTARLKEWISLKGIGLGDSAERILQEWGEPLERLPSEYGFDWWVYHQQYQNYVQVGVDRGRVVALYSNSNQWQFGGPLGSLGNRSQVRQALGLPLEWVLRGNVRYMRNKEKASDLYLVAHVAYGEFFYDMIESEKVTSIKLLFRQTYEQLDGFLGLMTAEMVSSYERQLFLLANAIRVRHGLPPFEWNERAAAAARKHSIDMGIRDYFSHDTPDGRTPLDRILAEGLRIRRVGENIAANLSAIDAHEALMNSPGHRVNLLSDMTHLGTGTSVGHRKSTYEIYHTQKFISF